MRAFLHAVNVLYAWIVGNGTWFNRYIGPVGGWQFTGVFATLLHLPTSSRAQESFFRLIFWFEPAYRVSLV
jgi:hypothetical protein